VAGAGLQAFPEITFRHFQRTEFLADGAGQVARISVSSVLRADLVDDFQRRFGLVEVIKRQGSIEERSGLAGAQLPFGGYKGSAIALMVELMAAGLTRDWLSFEAAGEDTRDGGPAKGGELLLAMDPARFVPDGDRAASLDHAEVLFAGYLEQDGTRLPSDRRYAARKRTPIEGIRIPEGLYDEIRGFMK